MKDYTIILETDRLILRKFTMEDVDDLFEYASDPEVTEFLSFETYKSKEEAIDYLSKVVLPKYEEENSYKWAIELKESGKMIGCIDCVNKVDLKNKRAEIGYLLNRLYWGQGIMPEAGRAVIKYLFEEGLVRIEAIHDINNPKSGRVMQKIGMTHEGTLKKCRLQKKYGIEKFIDCELYAIINPDA